MYLFVYTLGKNLCPIKLEYDYYANSLHLRY